ncbi:hypothetical protein MGWOODY_Smn3829 [hydrothermal vent metagenome]|uniref:Uncharacterized protein n=1 Tax=hydrothermal vent metagenome TaxID=652676 RepID=A0A160TMH0_9ZZZZ
MTDVALSSNTVEPATVLTTLRPEELPTGVSFTWARPACRPGLFSLGAEPVTPLP